MPPTTRDLAISAFLICLTQAPAQVRINELGAASNDRVISRNADGLGLLGGGPAWWAPDFDASVWQGGTTPVGFGYGGIATDTSDTMLGRTPTLYLRFEFQASAAEAASAAALDFDIDYDDAFVAYLNGREIARGNAGASTLYLFAAQVAYQERSAGGSAESHPLGASDGWLVEGTNVLAIEIHNSAIDSSGLKCDASLSTSTSSFVGTGSGCRWFPGVVSPSGGVFDPALVYQTPGSGLPEAEYSDWVEIRNDGASPVDLSGWGLSDDPATPFRWTFPPGTLIAAGECLLVLADDLTWLNGVTGTLHANFGLSAGGETLTLSDTGGSVVSMVDFPAQYATHSYGWDSTTMGWAYHATPTPGAANTGETFSDRADAPDFDIEGGFHTGSVTLTLTSETPTALFRYTTDGSTPTPDNGSDYTAPLVLNPINSKTGHTIRARAFATGHIPSRTKSHTYLIDQASQIRTIPALTLTGESSETFYWPHGVMAIDGGYYDNNNWMPGGSGSYNHPIMRGPSFERPVDIGFHHADGSPGFHESAGIRLAGSTFSRRRLRLNRTYESPWQSSEFEKPSFNVFFRGDYGSDELDHPWLGEDYPATTFGDMRIRAGKNDVRNPFIRDELMRRLYRDMGQESSTGIINTLYLNGEFKGYYNMVERLREPFMRSHHGGDGQWDIRQVDEYEEGDSAAWDEMMTRLGADLGVLANWQDALEYLDPVNMADYFVLNIYGATWDWPYNNWVGARERSVDGRFRLYVWDAEGGFGIYGEKPAHYDTIAGDLLSESDALSLLFQRLLTSPEWRLTFADRVNRHFFNNGVLDDRNPTTCRARVIANGLYDDFRPILNFVHNENPNFGFLDVWLASSYGRRSHLLGPNRNDFASHGLWPDVAPPSFSTHGGEVAAGYPLEISAAPGTTIRYTLDGSDPRLPGGTADPSAPTYSAPVTLNGGGIVVKARAYDASTQTWSALTEASFLAGLTVPAPGDLVFSELMYHPADVSASEATAGYSDQDDFEFIEILNTSAYNLDLSEVSFTDGVTFSFAGSAVTSLAPGGRVRVVSNPAAFSLRYGSGLDSSVAGAYGGNLSNSGETVSLSLLDPGPTLLYSLTYTDDPPWPVEADGSGSSLLLGSPTAAADHQDPALWEASSGFGGMLGGAGLSFDYATWADFTFDAASPASLSLFGGDPDGDGFSNGLEHVFGSDPLVANSAIERPVVRLVDVGGSEFAVMDFPRSRWSLPYEIGLESFDAVNGWLPVAPSAIDAASPVPAGDSQIESWRVTDTVTGAAFGLLRLSIIESAP